MFVMTNELREYLYLKNPWWQGREFEVGVLRERYLTQLQARFVTELIQIVTGLRRVGKSTLVLQLIDSLLKKKAVRPQDVLFFSAEEPALNKLSFTQVINWFRAERNLAIADKIYVFVDEVQTREGWEAEIKSLYDTQNIKFVLTGSSAMLLSERLSLLTGRYLKTRVYPLSFREYLKFLNVKAGQLEQFRLQSYLEKYLMVGGMPEFVLSQVDGYLETTVESILFKDLVTKFAIRNPAILTELLLLLADRVATPTSALKLSKILQTSKDSVADYLEYLKQTFLVDTLSSFSTSRNKIIYNPDKYYFEDLGILNRYASKHDLGASAENALFSYLRQNLGNKLRLKWGYWHERKNELDFIISDTDGWEVFESKWVGQVGEISFKPLEKLLDQAGEVSKNHPLHLSKLKQITYATANVETRVKIKGVAVRLVPLRLLLTHAF